MKCKWWWNVCKWVTYITDLGNCQVFQQPKAFPQKYTCPNGHGTTQFPEEQEQPVFHLKINRWIFKKETGRYIINLRTKLVGSLLYLPLVLGPSASSNSRSAVNSAISPPPSSDSVEGDPSLSFTGGPMGAPIARIISAMSKAGEADFQSQSLISFTE